MMKDPFVCVTALRSSESVETISQVKNQIAQLYSTLHIEQYQIEREKELLERLEDLQKQLQPMNQV